MEYKHLSPDFAVGAQISAADIAALKRAGFRSIICTRPDGEDLLQPGQAKIAAAAREAGVAFGHVPVVPGQITADDVSRFTELLGDLPGPVFAYCRSGNRAATLWSQAQDRKASTR